MAPAKLPIPICTAIPTPRLYCPDKLLPSLWNTKPGQHSHFGNEAEQFIYRNVPSDNTWESSIATRNNKKGPKILDAVMGLRYVNCKADQAQNKTSENKRRSNAKFIGVVGENED